MHAYATLLYYIRLCIMENQAKKLALPHKTQQCRPGQHSEQSIWAQNFNGKMFIKFKMLYAKCLGCLFPDFHLVIYLYRILFMIIIAI